MQNRRPIFTLLTLGLIAAVLTGCAGNSLITTPASAPTALADSHSGDAEPDYTVVFPQDSVNRIDITLAPEDWTALQTEMTGQFGEAGTGEGQGFARPGGMPGGGEMPEPPEGFGEWKTPPEGFEPGQQPPGIPGGQDGFAPGNPPAIGAMGGFDFGDTSYVPGTITFNGETWEHVGFRYSGNSTLQNSWRSGTQKISFRLDFDEYEDEYPATADQRFFGFKQISFKSNAMDDSYIREKVTADIFRAAGVVSSQTAFYAVYIDYGEGPRYFGVYTAVEIVDDTVIETQFADGSGNVYKPDGTGAAFMEGTFNEASFEKQTNEDAADWSDIQAVFAALHADTRTSDPAAWRAGLEAVFDVDAFIRWLAVDTIIQNWDTYGAMAHNYYLYTDPADGLVTWIPWDNNMALSARSMGAGRGGENRAGPGGGPGGGVRELDLSSVSDQWPLIRYLMDDPTYQARYRQYLQETIAAAWQPETLEAAYRKYHDLIAPYVAKEEQGFTQVASVEVFDAALDALIQHAHERYDAVVAYLGD